MTELDRLMLKAMRWFKGTCLVMFAVSGINLGFIHFFPTERDLERTILSAVALVFFAVSYIVVEFMSAVTEACRAQRDDKRWTR